MAFIIKSSLPKQYKEKWKRQFVDQDREYLESIWRRSEDAENLNDLSSRRRRIIHVIDKYALLKNKDKYDFAIVDCYMWLCSTLPREEMARYIKRIESACESGNWSKKEKKWHREELSFSYILYDKHPKDVEAGRDFGLEYQTVECIIRSKNFPEERIERESPWAVYDSGIREKGSRVAKPNVVTDMKELIEYLPAQLEIGGGASLELGIPPLNYFHTVYDLYREGFERFAYGDYDKLLDTVLPDPDAFYSKLASLPYLRALLAEPNNFYKTITDLHRKNLLLGPIITNNFDGMCSLMGLEELYVRKYDDVHIIPSVSFPEGVKSLLVVGSHADRRRIQQAAKQEGLKIIYVDPEKYVDHEGRQIDYPLEKIESDDILVPLKASEFAEELSNALSGPSKIV